MISTVTSRVTSPFVLAWVCRGSLAMTGVPQALDGVLAALYTDIGETCAQVYTASKLGFLGAALPTAQTCAFLSIYGAGDKCCGAAPVAPPPVAPIKPMMMSKCPCDREHGHLTPLTCFGSC
jgi:hypothetical protein